MMGNSKNALFSPLPFTISCFDDACGIESSIGLPFGYDEIFVQKSFTSMYSFNDCPVRSHSSISHGIIAFTIQVFVGLMHSMIMALLVKTIPTSFNISLSTRKQSLRRLPIIKQRIPFLMRGFFEWRSRFDKGLLFEDAIFVGRRGACHSAFRPVGGGVLFAS